MTINVNLATNRLQIETATGGDLYSSVTYINIVAVSRAEDVNRLVTAPTPSGAPTTTTTQDDFIVRLHLADQLQVDIPLAYVANQAGWTNDQAGYDQAEADIYAAFPSGGGGGSGTVTSVGFNPGTTGFGQAVGPITGSGTFLLTGYAAVRSGNTLFVDAVNGNDGTGTPDRFDLPYLTVNAAILAAGEGDQIQVRPGTYAGASDTAGTAAALYFLLEPGALVSGFTLTNAQSQWVVNGIVKGNVQTAAFFARLDIYGGVTGNVVVTDFSYVAITGNVSGTIDVDGSTISLFGSQVIGMVTIENIGIVNVEGAAFLTGATTATTGTLQGASSQVAGNITGLTVLGDIFFDSITGSPGDVSTKNADGSWSWAAPSGGASALVLLVDTDNVNLTGSATTYYIEDTAGVADVTDPGTVAAGIVVTVSTGPVATRIRFAPSGVLDGLGAGVDVTAGAHAQFTSLGGGNWITTG